MTFAVLLLALQIANSIASPAGRDAPSRTPVRAARTLVVVDAGHGGPDRGMSGTTAARKKVYEADITLAIAKKLKAALVSRGIDVLMTRSTDTLIALRDRGVIDIESEATRFLSFHVNVVNPRWRIPRLARGFETYFLSDVLIDDDRRVAEMENDADRFLGGDVGGGVPLLSFLVD